MLKTVVNKDDNLKKRKWDTVLTAIRTVWHSGRVDTMGQRLSDYRSQLTLRLLVVLNTHFRQQKQGLESIRDEIVEVISVNCRDLMSAINPEANQAVAAIFKTRGGTSSAISRPSESTSGKGLNKAENGQLLRTSITYLTGGNKGQPESADFSTSHDVSDYTQMIIDALHFRGITERRASILEAHSATFEWIWENSSRPHSKAPKARWDPLGPWLASRGSDPTQSRCYWVSGKAGSGKSSLMKYLQEDPRLDAHLEKWAGDKQLVLSSFYFWYAGTELQKSHAGLLRGLLLDILQRRRELAPVLFPDICRSIITGELSGRLDLTHTELRAAFSTLVRSVPQDMRICFLIDGIDEYTGDPNDICQLFLEATTNTSIKAIVSSRPIPACHDRFQLCPGLRLHDLTHNDIFRYVTDNLGTHRLMAAMERAEPGVKAEVVNKVTDRASGVFLWVVIVVKNLILRLQHYDTKTALLEEIEKLPPDLEKLYDHMLGGVDERSKALASRFLQLMLRSTEMGEPYSFTLLQLSYAVENDNYTACLQDTPKPLSNEALEWRCEATAGRLRSHCCGLCEVYEAPEQSVRFIHRTVVEFLQINVVWESVTAITSATKFDVDLALLSSSVSELKAMPTRPCTSKPNHFVLDRMLRMVNYETHLSREARAAFHGKYLPEMRRALWFHQHNPELFSTPAQQVAAVETSYESACRQLELRYPFSLMVSLCFQINDSYRYIYDSVTDLPGFHRKIYFRELTAAYLMMHMADERQLQVRLMISHAVGKFPRSPMFPVSFDHTSTSARRFWSDRWKLALHMDVNRPWSFWEFLLHYCFSMLNDTEDSGFNFEHTLFSKSLLVVISEFLKQGAPPTSTISLATKSLGWMKERREVSAFTIIMTVLERVWRSTCLIISGDVDCIADLSCEIENSLVNGGGEPLDRRGRAGLAAIKEDNSRARQRRDKKHQSKQEMSLSLFGKSSAGLTPTGAEQRRAKSPAAAISSGSTVNGDKTGSAKTSPWLVHKARRELQKNTSNTSGASESTEPAPQSPSTARQSSTAAQNEWKKQWNLTHPTRRVELLSTEQQNIVADLAKPNPTAKEKRNALSQLSRLGFDKQREILDCVQTMKATSLSKAGDAGT